MYIFMYVHMCYVSLVYLYCTMVNLSINIGKKYTVRVAAKAKSIKKEFFNFENGNVNKFLMQ